MSSNNNPGKSAKSVNVEWTPGETGLPKKDDQKPTFGSEIVKFDTISFNSLPSAASIGMVAGEIATVAASASPIGVALLTTVVAAQAISAGDHVNDKLELREDQKLIMLVNELKKTDPKLVAKVAALTDGVGGKKDKMIQADELEKMITRKDWITSDPLDHLDAKENGGNGDHKVDVNELRKEMQKFLKEKGIAPPVEASHASNHSPANVSDVRTGDNSRTV
jgi:hypothetical protein